MTEATYKFAPVRSEVVPALRRVSLVFSWGEHVHAVSLREGQALVVGRAEPAQVVIEDRSLSRTHARLSMREQRLYLEDLGSTNGSFVNGNQVKDAMVAEGDLVRLGSVELRLSGLSSGRVTSKAWVSSQEWTQRVTEELARARVLGRPFAVVAVRAESSDAVHSTLPVREVDVACRYAPHVSLLLLPEARGADVQAWAASLGRERTRLALGAALAPEAGASAESLLGTAIQAARQAKLGGVCEIAEKRERASREVSAPVVKSPCMLRLYEIVARAARTTLPVLVLGETGSGKEHVALAVHQQSLRSGGPFRALNCATIPENLIESVLFGHERGAFTGADKQVQGVFEQASGGTVFLDEVGELCEKAQAALLRVLETKRIVRVGGTREVEVDVRIVAATHRDLGAMVMQGAFREDLLFRLDALSFSVPPLRERPEEIVPLAQRFLERARVEWNAQATGISSDALDALLSYRWPGNVRQLKNTIERAVAVCTGSTIELMDLPESVLAVPVMQTQELSASGDEKTLPERVKEFEANLIREALQRANGNQAQAARSLGIPRRTLAHKVQAAGLVP